MEWENRIAEWKEELELFDRLEGWVPLAEAEERTGASRSAIRSWYRTGQIASRLADSPHGPQRLVKLSEVEARANRSPRIRNKADQMASAEAQIEMLQRQVADLERRVLQLEAGIGRPK